MHVDRLLIVLATVGWYFVVRSLLYNGVSNRNIFIIRNDFEFWWSILLALPLTALSVFLVLAAIRTIHWIFDK